MKQKISNFLTKLWDETDHLFRLTYCNPSPMKQFIFVLVIGGALAIANIYIVATSIYNIGKRDAETEFMKLQHIESLKLRQKADTTFSIGKEELEMEDSQHKKNDAYEYE